MMLSGPSSKRYRNGYGSIRWRRSSFLISLKFSLLLLDVDMERDELIHQLLLIVQLFTQCQLLDQDLRILTNGRVQLIIKLAQWTYWTPIKVCFKRNDSSITHKQSNNWTNLTFHDSNKSVYWQTDLSTENPFILTSPTEIIFMMKGPDTRVKCWLDCLWT